MKRYSFCLLFLSILLFSACKENSNQPETDVNPFSDPILQDIYNAADRRDYAKLKPFATDENSTYRYAFARVMGSVIDTAGLPELYKLQNETRPDIRLYTAFALGQYRDTINLSPLQSFLKKETIPEIKAEILEAIGKCANRRAMEFLINYFPETEPEKSGRMWGIYRAMLRDVLGRGDLDKIAESLESSSEDLRLATVYVFNRQRDFPVDDYRGQLEKLARTDKSAEVRITATMALGKMDKENKLLMQIATLETDPRIRAAAIAGLRNDGSDAYREAIASALNDGNCWVAMNAADKMAGIHDSNFIIDMKNLAFTSKTPEVRAAVIVSFLALDSLREEGWNLWKRARSQYKNKVEQAVLFKKLSDVPAAIDTLDAYATEDSPIGTAAAEALIAGAVQFQNWKPFIYKNAKKSFQKGLLSQCELFASALLDSDLIDRSQFSIAELESAASHFSKEGEVETRNALRKAIAKLQGEEFVPEKPGNNHPIDWDLVSKIPQNTPAIMYVGKIQLHLRLLIEDAPGSVANFVQLANEGFYDGTYFHRIVPDFVSQGGGPRGDGYGSTDYTIRSEFSPLSYGSGVAGLASAGKDTEGCQFFFTHIPTPHLDGRYTIFGALESGYLNLTDIYTGSRIDSVRVHY